MKATNKVTFVKITKGILFIKMKTISKNKVNNYLHTPYMFLF
jgi:hypothetical protein